MKDDLAIVNRIIEWHQTIKGHVKLVGESISDREALLALDTARPDWIPGKVEIVAEKQKRLQQAISFLEEGLRGHFAYEEEVLPPLLGELFMRALILDHQEIAKEINETKLAVIETKLEGLGREELLFEESHMQEVINGVSQLIEEHATREEVILEMLKRVLEERGQGKS